jgi:hypothetical protein
MVVVAWLLLIALAVCVGMCIGVGLYLFACVLLQPVVSWRTEKRMAAFVEKIDNRDEQIFWLETTWDQPAIGDYERSPSLP